MKILEQLIFFSGVCATVGSAACTCRSQARDQQLSASLSSAAITPPITAAASGTGRVDLLETRGLDSDPTYEQYNIAWQFQATALAGPVTAIHLHEGPAGTVGRVIYDFPLIGSGGNQAGGYVGYRGLIPFSEMYELAGQPSLYVDVHTEAYTNGEVRGQLQLVHATEWHDFFCEY